VSASDPGGISILALTKMLDYIRYIGVVYPPKVDYYLKNSKGGISFNFGPGMPDDTQEDFRNGTLPYNFG